jgi:uncharacterized membrane protein YhiD involved in acid resistance
MPEWLQDTFHADADLHSSVLALRLAVALALGCAVAGVYRLTHGRRGEPAAGLTATLVMLTVLIALVTLVIGNSVARAFSLVGALAIVRFRTVVEDTRDTAFVIFAVALGMAVGAGFLKVALVGLPFAATAAFLFRPPNIPAPGPSDFSLALRVGTGHDPEALVREPFGKHLERWRLVSMGTARQGAALDLTYAVRLRQEAAAAAFVAELNGLEGIQGVELRQA